jgi:transcriptional regulator with XRE-family HTH domain
MGLGKMSLLGTLMEARRSGKIMITAAQLRAGRALVGLSQAELAVAAGVSPRTVKRAEAGATMHVGSLSALAVALAHAGVAFIGENGGGVGVRLRKKAKK